MLSKYVSVEEFERSQTAIRYGIDNHMNPAQLNSARMLAIHVLDKIRAYYNAPLTISSGFRGPMLNRLIGGAPTSQHCVAEAADFTIGRPVEQVFQDIKSGKIPGLEFDQLIQEFGAWVHISYRPGHNRHQALRAVHKDGRAVYTTA